MRSTTMRDTGRTMPTWALLGAFVLVAVALAGCIGAMGQTSTGKSMEDPAHERADDWNPQASLVGVYAAESDDRHHAHGERSHAPMGPSPYHADAFNTSWGAVGNGQAPAWVYMYEAGDEALVVVVDGNGTVIDEEETQAHNQTPITGWNLDSTEAVQTIAENDEDWAQANPSMAMYALMQDAPEEDPLWMIAIMGEGTSGFGVVNATTGEYVNSFTFDMHGGWGNWDRSQWEHNRSWEGSGSWDWSDRDHRPTEKGSFEDVLTVVEPEKEHTFEINADGHNTLNMELALEDSVWQSVIATLTGPEGQEITLEADSSEKEDHARLSNPSPGLYEVTIAFDQGPMVLEDGAYQEYVFNWCAPGTDMGYSGDWDRDWEDYAAC